MSFSSNAPIHSCRKVNQLAKSASIWSHRWNRHLWWWWACIRCLSFSLHFNSFSHYKPMKHETLECHVSSLKDQLCSRPDWLFSLIISSISPKSITTVEPVIPDSGNLGHLHKADVCSRSWIDFNWILLNWILKNMDTSKFHNPDVHLLPKLLYYVKQIGEFASVARHWKLYAQTSQLLLYHLHCVRAFTLCLCICAYILVT